MVRGFILLYVGFSTITVRLAFFLRSFSQFVHSSRRLVCVEHFLYAEHNSFQHGRGGGAAGEGKDGSNVLSFESLALENREQ